MTTREILREKVGVCREYVKIFSEMSELAGFKVKNIRGFAKGPGYIPGKNLITFFNILYLLVGRYKRIFLMLSSSSLAVCPIFTSKIAFYILRFSVFGGNIVSCVECPSIYSNRTL